MANKDGIVSIGFDYKKELDEVCATIEKELNSLGGDINLSDGIKKQMAEVKKNDCRYEKRYWFFI